MADSEWTIESLKAHYDQRFIDQDRAVQAALNAAEKAVTKAENASEKRFDAVNEFRAQLADQAATFMPRSEAELQFSNLRAAPGRYLAITIALVAAFASVGAVIAAVVH